jgi:hypothetical protein
MLNEKLGRCRAFLIGSSSLKVVIVQFVGIVRSSGQRRVDNLPYRVQLNK